MRVPRMLLLGALGATVMVVSSFGVAGTASAEVSPLVACSSGQFCAYKDASFGGTMFPFVNNDGDWGNNSQGEGFINDEASSFKNLTGKTAAAWEDVSWGGPINACLSAGGSVAGLGAHTDEASSNWIGDCNPH